MLRSIGRLLLGLLGAATVLLIGLWLWRHGLRGESLSDLQFYAWMHPGRICDGIRVHAKPYDGGVVSVTNQCGKAIHDLRVTIKYFAYDGNAVIERTHAVLEDGATATFPPPSSGPGDLGMIYVCVRCDGGVAVQRGWWSYWDGPCPY